MGLKEQEQDVWDWNKRCPTYQVDTARDNDDGQRFHVTLCHMYNMWWRTHHDKYHNN